MIFFTSSLDTRHASLIILDDHTVVRDARHTYPFLEKYPRVTLNLQKRDCTSSYFVLICCFGYFLVYCMLLQSTKLNVELKLELSIGYSDLNINVQTFSV